MKCTEQGWKCEEWDGNACAGNWRGNARNLGENAKIVGNKGRDTATHGGNLSIAIEMT